MGRVIELQPGSGRHGAERHTYQLVDGLASCDVDVVIYGEYHPQHVFHELERTERLKWGNFRLSRPLRWLYTFAAVIVDTVGRDDVLIHTHLRNADIMGLAAGFITGTPVVCTLHGRTTKEGKKLSAVAKSVNRIHKVLLGTVASEVIVISDYIGKFATSELGIDQDRITKIYNASDPERFVESGGRLREEVGISGDAFVAVQVGVGPVKRTGELLSISERIIKGIRDREVHFVFVGECGELDYYRRRSVRTGIKKNVHFLGWRSDVPELLSGADLLCHLCTEEAFGRAMTEAMLAGVPVVAYSGGAAQELMSNGETGLIVESGEKEELARQVYNLVKNEPKRQELAEKGREYAKEYFTVDRFVDETVEVLKNHGV